MEPDRLGQREEGLRQARTVSSQETQEIEANGDSCIGTVIASYCALYSINFQSEQPFVSMIFILSSFVAFSCWGTFRKQYGANLLHNLI